MVLVVGRQGIAGSKVHPTEWRGELFTHDSTEFNLPVISEEGFMNFSDTFHSGDTIAEFG